MPFYCIHRRLKTGFKEKFGKKVSRFISHPWGDMADTEPPYMRSEKLIWVEKDPSNRAPGNR